MAASGGHWSSLAEAQKLTQTVQVPGVIEENVRAGALMALVPVWQLKGLNLKWLRENAGQVAKLATVGSVLTWTDNVTYTEQDVSLKTIYVQTPLDKYVEGVYGSFNNYAAIQLIENRKAILLKVSDLALYGDLTYSNQNLEADGIHALAQASATNGLSESLDIDEGEAGLSVNNLRAIEDAMKYGIDFYYFPRAIGRRLDAYLQEAGIGTPMAQVQLSPNDIGIRVNFFNGIPIVRTDHLVGEQANTGVGSDARAKNSSGDIQYSVFPIKRGNVANREPGLTFVWGGDMGSDGELIKVDMFEHLEDFDASGMRVMNYSAWADGSSMALGRIYDIEDVAVVA